MAKSSFDDLMGELLRPLSIDWPRRLSLILAAGKFESLVLPPTRIGPGWTRSHVHQQTPRSRRWVHRARRRVEADRADPHSQRSEGLGSPGTRAQLRAPPRQDPLGSGRPNCYS